MKNAAYVYCSLSSVKCCWFTPCRPCEAGVCGCCLPMWWLWSGPGCLAASPLRLILEVSQGLVGSRYSQTCCHPCDSLTATHIHTCTEAGSLHFISSPHKFESFTSLFCPWTVLCSQGTIFVLYFWVKSFKSLSIAEWCNTMVIEPMAHWWKPLHWSITTRVSAATFPEKSQVVHNEALNKAINRLALQLTCVWTMKLKLNVTMKLKLKWGPKTHLQLQLQLSP